MKLKKMPIDMRCLDTIAKYLFYTFVIDFTLEMLDLVHRTYEADESFRSLDFMVHTRLWVSQVILQIILGTLVPLALLAANQLWRFSEARRKAMYLTAGVLTLVGIFAMRWNVVIGGPTVLQELPGIHHLQNGVRHAGGPAAGHRADDSAVCDLRGAGQAPAAVDRREGWRVRYTGRLRRLPCRSRSGKRWSARSATWRGAWLNWSSAPGWRPKCANRRPTGAPAPETAGTVPATPLLAETAGLLAVLGRALLGLAGAYLLRALTEGGTPCRDRGDRHRDPLRHAVAGLGGAHSGRPSASKPRSTA